MTETYLAEHFEALDKWKGQKRIEGDAEQGRAYEELKSAYELTELWAKQLKDVLFPSGTIKIRKRPTSQANTFLHYNWARIYPELDSPSSLAYTVGISTSEGFVVKIDTVQASPELRTRYEDLRISLSNDSPIVAILPKAEGLKMSMSELVDWSVEAISGFRLSYDEVVTQLGLQNEKGTAMSMDDDDEISPLKATPLNRILYGPPGTGKTYETRVAALKMLGEKVPENRDDIICRYEELIDAGQIRFVTFHPSLAYEDFVEGLRPKLDGADSGSLSYTLRDGIFKSISKDARRNWLSWKNKSSTKSFDELWDELVEEMEASDGPLVIPTPRTKFEIYEIDDGVIRFRNAKEKHYTMNVRVLEAIYDGVREIPGGLSTYYAGLLEWLKLRVPGTPGNVPVELKQYVLIIDEINRGNIPSIFGELITLLEPSKRLGMSEPLEVVLPTSQERFQVPPNLHVLGTMNTADRSVEALDVALRRRFDFMEMMPKPELLGTVDDVDLQMLLRAINKRLEALVDRDHTIGHAFFIGVGSLEELRSVFQNKVIPLLQEFFYGDWSRIGLVLGNEFVKVRRDSQASLFARGFPFDGELPERYELTAPESWTNSVFQSIYAS